MSFKQMNHIEFMYRQLDDERKHSVFCFLLGYVSENGLDSLQEKVMKELTAQLEAKPKETERWDKEKQVIAWSVIDFEEKVKDYKREIRKFTLMSDIEKYDVRRNYQNAMKKHYEELLADAEEKLEALKKVKTIIWEA